jgi:A/G-specific adenine glycosylase
MSDRAPASLLTASALAWYRAHRRALPWREAPEPYAILLSELMCQQTRIDTALPYFARFMARWPTLEALAAAEEDEVVHAWAGLGYYSRARNLHRAARAAAAAGGLPADVEALRALPGIGPYTAGAIASIAFGLPAPVVDGNVERVLSRVDDREEDPRAAVGRRALWDRAEALVRAADAPGDLNQALMELGALVCTPRAPRCGACPWAERCLAARAGDPERLPNKAAKAPPRPVLGVAAVVRRGGALLLGRRPPGLLGGLWEPIGDEHDPSVHPEQALEQALRRRVGLTLRAAAPLGEVVHTFTHRRLTLRVFAAEADGALGGDGSYEALRLVHGDPAEAVALSTLARRALALEAAPAQLALLAAAPPAPPLDRRRRVEPPDRKGP